MSGSKENSQFQINMAKVVCIKSIWEISNQLPASLKSQHNVDYNKQILWKTKSRY